MNANDWKCELQRLFEIFERESTISLRKINRCFDILGRPFGDEFRQYFLKMSTIRLDTSFDAVVMERQFYNQMRMPSMFNSSQADSNEIASNSNIGNPTKANGGTGNASQNGSLLELKIEHDVDVPIELADSDDDSVEAEEHYEEREANDAIAEHMESNDPQETEDANGNSDGEHDDTDLNVGNNGEAHVKCEPKTEIEEETVDLPFEVFDPVKENERSSAENRTSISESMDDQGQANSSLSVQNEAKRTDGKRFKCNNCAYTSNREGNFKKHRLIHDTAKSFKCALCEYAFRKKSNLIKHQRTHDMQMLMGVGQDPRDGFFKCTHCDQRFAKWCNLKGHLTRSHKNNQRLFNCERCMRPFEQKIEKDRHEVRCQNRRYECYLCKNYVTVKKYNMQEHVRTHTGARPFKCTVCNKRYRQQRGLKNHLNSVHN